MYWNKVKKGSCMLSSCSYEAELKRLLFCRFLSPVMSAPAGCFWRFFLTSHRRLCHGARQRRLNENVFGARRSFQLLPVSLSAFRFTSSSFEIHLITFSNLHFRNILFQWWIPAFRVKSWKDGFNSSARGGGGGHHSLVMWSVRLWCNQTLHPENVYDHSRGEMDHKT